jgi:hypothetical protein
MGMENIELFHGRHLGTYLGNLLNKIDVAAKTP